MFSTAQNIIPNRLESNPFSEIRSTLKNRALSKGAKLIFILLRISAGKRGYVKYGISKLAEGIGSSVSQTKEYLKELKHAGMIEAIATPGRCNTWIILRSDEQDQQAEDRPGEGGGNIDRGVAGGPTPLKNVQKTSEKKRLNVSCNGLEENPTIPPTTEEPASTKEPGNKVFDTTLLHEILETTGDYKSKGCWIKCIRVLPEEEIRIALSSYKTALNDGQIIQRPGAYVLRILQNRNPEISFRTEQRPEQKPTRDFVSIEIPLKEPNWDENLSRVKAVKSMLEKRIRRGK